MRAVLACYPIPGHLNPNIALANALRDQGHTVAVYSGSGARAAVEKEGFQFFPYGPSMDATLSDTLLPQNGQSAASTLAVKAGWGLRVKQLNATLKAWLLESIPTQVSDLEGIVEQFQPEVLVTDVALLGPSLVLSERVDVPLAAFSVLAGCSIPGPEAPPWGRGLPSPRNSWSRFRATLEKQFISWVTSDFRASANQIRAGYDLPPVHGPIAEQYRRLPLFMVASTPSLDYFRKDLPESVQYLGACVADGGAPERGPDWLEALDDSTPVVHVTEGTIHTREPLLLRAAVEGLSGLAMQVVMTTGRHRTPEELHLPPAGSNIRVEQFVSHSALFPKTRAVVTTGGAGTVTKALISGVPLVVVPTAWELPENAQRVVEAGAGLRIQPDKCSPQRLRAAVERVLEEPTFRQNAERIGRDLRNQGGLRRAVQLLEELVKSKRNNGATKE